MLLSISVFLFNDAVSAQPSVEPDPNVTPVDEPKLPQKEPEKEAAGPRFLNLYPGIMLQAAEMNITGRVGAAYMRQGNEVVVQPLFDFRSRDLQLGESFGLNLIGHASTFHFNHQEVPAETSAETSSGEGSDSGGGSSSRTIDLGSGIDGDYSYLAPAVYFSFGNTTDGPRIGFGYGVGRVNFSGTFVTDNPTLGWFAIRMFQGQRDTVLRDMSVAYLGSGLLDPKKSDPIFTALVADMRSGRNLEALGYYILAKGWRPSADNVIMIFALQSAARSNGQTANAAEMVAIAALQQGFVNVKAASVPVYRLFVEFPIIGDFRGYINAGYTNFKAGSMHYELTAVNAALTYRISL